MLLLDDFIKQLQEVSKNNPGIEVGVEWGIPEFNFPKLEIFYKVKDPVHQYEPGLYSNMKPSIFKDDKILILR